jgi:hypothetical protein
MVVGLLSYVRTMRPPWSEFSHCGKGLEQMTDPGDTGCEDDAIDLEAALWVRGVDYVAAWRDATSAATALTDALASAGIDKAEIHVRAVSAPDGSGALDLRVPPTLARKLAQLIGQNDNNWRAALGP